MASKALSDHNECICKSPQRVATESSPPPSRRIAGTRDHALCRSTVGRAQQTLSCRSFRAHRDNNLLCRISSIQSVETHFLGILLSFSFAMAQLSSFAPSSSGVSSPLCHSDWRLASDTHRLSFAFWISPVARRSSLCSRNLRFYFPHGVKIEAIDAIEAFNCEEKRTVELKEAGKLKIGIVGFGNFGRFLARRMVQQGHTVLAHSRSNYHGLACRMGVSFFSDPHDFCEEHPDVVVLCSSILSTESVIRSLPLQRLKRNTLIVDVLSVKVFPRYLLLQVLPPEFDILCTHPMFGPQSGKTSWNGLPFVYEKVRIGEGTRADRCEKFLNIFYCEGCRMVEMSCEEHDRYAAGSQFITHTVGRVLGKLALESTPINTKGYEKLLHLVENTNSDSFDLYYGLFMYNVNATEQLDRLDSAFEAIKKQLFSKLHDILRKQMFEAPVQESTEKNSSIASQNYGVQNFLDQASALASRERILHP